MDWVSEPGRQEERTQRTKPSEPHSAWTFRRRRERPAFVFTTECDL